MNLMTDKNRRTTLKPFVDLFDDTSSMGACMHAFYGRGTAMSLQGFGREIL